MGSWERFKEVFGDLLVCFFGAWMAWGFYTILTGGAWVGVEPVTWVAALELAVSIAIFILGVERLMGDLKWRERKR